MERTEVNALGLIVPTAEIVCAGMCERRGPQVQLVDSVADITCADCVAILERH